MEITQFNKLENKLIEINNELVLLDKDVAELYGIEPKRLKEQLKRNIEKFPKDYAYQLSKEMLNIMVSQNATPSKQSFGGALPWVFTENSEVIETTTKFEFNLGFAKVSRSVKRVKK